MPAGSRMRCKHKVVPIDDASAACAEITAGGSLLEFVLTGMLGLVLVFFTMSSGGSHVHPDTLHTSGTYHASVDAGTREPRSERLMRDRLRRYRLVPPRAWARGWRARGACRRRSWPESTSIFRMIRRRRHDLTSKAEAIPELHFDRRRIDGIQTMSIKNHASNCPPPPCHRARSLNPWRHGSGWFCGGVLNGRRPVLGLWLRRRGRAPPPAPPRPPPPPPRAATASRRPPARRPAHDPPGRLGGVGFVLAPQSTLSPCPAGPPWPRGSPPRRRQRPPPPRMRQEGGTLVWLGEQRKRAATDDRRGLFGATGTWRGPSNLSCPPRPGCRLC